MNAPRPNPRRVAFDVLREVTGKDAYANLALAKRLVTADSTAATRASSQSWSPAPVV